jgi:hypothetical protein
MNEESKIKQIIDIKSDLEEFPAHRLVIMLGAADFFWKVQGMRNNPYELVALLEFLASIGANKEEEKGTLVLCFDSNYRKDTIDNDIFYANKNIFNKRKSGKYPNLEGFINNFKRDENDNPDNYMSGRYYGTVLFKYFYFDLVTSQNKFQNAKSLYNLMNQPLTTVSKECKPKENTAFQALEKICSELDFDEYYLYNCAWIRGFRGFQNETTGQILGTTAKQNRHFENMCELLYIFQHLQKPAYLLTEPDMLAYTHENQKQVGSLYLTPLNSTTKFIKENWSTKKGGKSRKQKRSKKASKSRKWRKASML